MKLLCAIISFSSQLMDKFNCQFNNHNSISICCATKSFQYFNKVISSYDIPDFIFYSLHSLSHEEALNNIRQLKDRFNNTKIILLDVENSTPTLILDYLKSGASCILSDINLIFIEYLILNYQTLHICVSVDIVRELNIENARLAVKINYDKSINEHLTSKEYQIITLLSKGYSYAESAKYMEMKLDTFRYHIKKIYKKMNANSKQKAIITYQNKFS